MTKIFITDYIETPDIEQEVFGKKVEIICLNEEHEENFPESISEADAVLVWHTKITELTIKRLKKCKAIVRYGVGYDNVDFQCAREYGIPFANTPDYGVHEVADTASSLILTLVRKVSNYNQASKSYESGWQEHTIKPLKRTNEHRLGIIGIGRIGTAVALRMKAFGMEIGFYDPYVVSGYEKSLGVKRFETLDELQRFSSIITIHAPLNDETYKMINAKFIDNLNEETIFVNTARGKIVDDLDTLYDGLIAGKLSGVGLDVLPQEPPAESERLIEAWKNSSHKFSSNIIITPHTSYYSDTAWQEMRIMTAENAMRALCGNTMKNVITK